MRTDDLTKQAIEKKAADERVFAAAKVAEQNLAAAEKAMSAAEKNLSAAKSIEENLSAANKKRKKIIIGGILFLIAGFVAIKIMRKGK